MEPKLGRFYSALFGWAYPLESPGKLVKPHVLPHVRILPVASTKMLPRESMEGASEAAPVRPKGKS